LGKRCYDAKELLEKYGYGDVEIILNEWNYIRGWLDEKWQYSLRTEKNLKGSSFVLACMCEGQASPLDMLMYYDARPCAMNGMFANETYQPLKTYYVIKAFSTLYDMETAATAQADDNLYACASISKDEGAILTTYYNDDDTLDGEMVKVEINGFSNTSGVKAEVYAISESEDLTLVKEEYFTGEKYAILLKQSLFTSYLIKLYKMN
jgi:hypothetical protein